MHVKNHFYSLFIVWPVLKLGTINYGENYELKQLKFSIQIINVYEYVMVKMFL